MSRASVCSWQDSANIVLTGFRLNILQLHHQVDTQKNPKSKLSLWKKNWLLHCIPSASQAHPESRFFPNCGKPRFAKIWFSRSESAEDFLLIARFCWAFPETEEISFEKLLGDWCSPARWLVVTRRVVVFHGISNRLVELLVTSWCQNPTVQQKGYRIIKYITINSSFIHHFTIN